MEDFVTFEIAKKLKEKGFTEPCINAINRFGCTYLNGWCEYLDERGKGDITLSDIKEDDYLLPTISQVLKWLRDEQEIFVCVQIMNDVSLDADGNIVDCWKFWLFDIYSTSDAHRIYLEELNEFDSYEEAALAGIEYFLSNLV